MRRYFLARLSILLLAASAALAQKPPTALSIVRQSIEKDRFNFSRAKDYTYVQRNESRELNAQGKVTKVESTTFDVIMLGGRTYRRQIAADDQPLPSGKARKAQEGFDREVEKRSRESDHEKKKRAADEEKSRQESRAFLAEIPEAFLFTLAGEERVDGHLAWVIDAVPKPGWKGKVKRSELLSKFKGRLWIDQREYQWVKVDATTIAPVSFGWVLAKLQPGARLSFEQKRFNDEVWLPVRAFTRVDARLALFKNVRAEMDVAWKDYRKFQADSRVLNAEEVPSGKVEH
ncbi:MAG: hypothetical protein HY821_11060 [Acidobacteria bacterium]|nr:hypothetical protein [Acidobacteriota bacterium]